MVVSVGGNRFIPRPDRQADGKVQCDPCKVCVNFPKRETGIKRGLRDPFKRMTGKRQQPSLRFARFDPAPDQAGKPGCAVEAGMVKKSRSGKPQVAPMLLRLIGSKQDA